MPRAVVLLGPPKTGSSHVQAFLANNQPYLEAHGWQWPRSVDGGRAGAKSYANLVTALAGISCRTTMWKNAPTLVDAIVSLCHGRSSEIAAYQKPSTTTLRKFRHEFERVAQTRRAPNIVLSAEDLAYFDGDDPTSVRVRRSLRTLLASFDDVTAVIVYRTPRVAAMQSTFTEELDWGWDGVETGARTPFSTWLFEKLHNGSLLQRPPWSSALNLARLADAYSGSGFRIQIVSSSGAAEDGLDVTDVVACEILGVPCTHGKAAWTRYSDRRTYETRFDSLAFSATMALRSVGCNARPRAGRMLQAAPGSTDGQSRAKAKLRLVAAEMPKLVADGARQRCSDLGVLESMMASFEDASLLTRYRDAMLHWHGRRNSSMPKRVFCELDTTQDSTRTALQRLAQRLGYVCAAASAIPAPTGAANDDDAATQQQPNSAALRDGLARSRGVHHTSWFFSTLCSPAAHCHLLDGAISWLVEATRAGHEFEVVMQSEERAGIMRRAGTSDAACTHGVEAHRRAFQPASATIAPPRMLYTLLANPFAGERCCYRGTHDRPQGQVPAARVLGLHLEALALLPSRLAALLLLLPYDDARPPIPGYLDVGAAAARLPFRASLRTLPNNTLGSYGMYLHAFASTRGAFDLYLFAEDDYLPTTARFDDVLAGLYSASFGEMAGCLAGVLQGRPVEPHSPFALHLESSHLMSAASLMQLYHHTYTVRRWNGSTAALMIALAKGQVYERRRGDYGPGPLRSSGTYYGNLQLGFGKLLREAGIDVKDWTAAYRTPYWNHHQLVDWTGPMHGFAVPFERVLFVPVQWLMNERVKQCCTGVDCDTVGTAAGDVCATSRQATDPDACCLAHRRTRPALHVLQRLRRTWSLPPNALALLTVTNGTDKCSLKLADGASALQLAASRSSQATPPSSTPHPARSPRGRPSPSVKRRHSWFRFW